MEVIDIVASPNTFTPISVDGRIYGLTIRHFRGMQYATITDRVGNIISGPVRCCNRKWLIPYPALGYAGAGNFMFIDDNDQYPDFRNFGSTCHLVYYTLEEIVNGSDQ